jgi:hypothetical protein
LPSTRRGHGHGKIDIVSTIPATRARPFFRELVYIENDETGKSLAIQNPPS